MGAGKRRERKRRGKGSQELERDWGAVNLLFASLEESGYLANKPRINPSYSHSLLCYCGQMRKGGEGTRARVCTEFAMGCWVFGEGAIQIGTPLGALSMICASSADGQPKPGVALTSATSPAQWLL